jgi:diacylglycerol kinase
MAEERESLLGGMLSKIKPLEKENKAQKEVKKEKKLVKSREWKFKGFYIMPENEARLRELQARFLWTEKRKVDESEILNLAIETLYDKIFEKIQKIQEK